MRPNTPTAALLVSLLAGESIGLLHHEIGEFAPPNEHVPHEDTAPAPTVNRRSLEVSTSAVANESVAAFRLRTRDGTLIKIMP